MEITTRLIDARANWVVSQCSGSILDIGGNQGHVFRGAGLDVTLLDINEFKPCEFPQVVADAHSLPFADNSFDCCVLAELLEHVHNPILCLREAVRVARKKIIFTVPDTYHWPGILNPFQTLRDKLEQNKDIPQEDIIREGNPTLIRVRDLQQMDHNRWYTQEMLESHLKYIGLPYQMQSVINKQAQPFDDGFSWFCGTILKESEFA